MMLPHQVGRRQIREPEITPFYTLVELHYQKLYSITIFLIFSIKILWKFVLFHIYNMHFTSITSILHVQILYIMSLILSLGQQS